jgi:hypothetical protein
MKVKRITYLPLHLLALLCLSATASFTGCISDTLSDCDVPHSITVRAYVRGSNAELGADDVKDLSLFVFDGESRFMYRIETAIGERVTLYAPRGEDLHIVAWGNLKEGAQTFTEPEPGDLLIDYLVELLPLTQASGPRFAGSPGDLFRGEITITSDEFRGEKILPIYREVGSMAITLRNLKAFTGYNDNNFSVAIRETYSVMDFSGRMKGGMVSYQPVGTFVNNVSRDEYQIPPFNMFPEETGVMIDIFHGDELIATISTDRSRNPIIVEKDKLTNVLIELKASVSVGVELSGWGETVTWKEF